MRIWMGSGWQNLEDTPEGSVVAIPCGARTRDRTLRVYLRHPGRDLNEQSSGRFSSSEREKTVSHRPISRRYGISVFVRMGGV